MSEDYTRIESMTLETVAGMTFDGIVNGAIAMAQRYAQPVYDSLRYPTVHFEVSGVNMSVRSDSVPELMIRDLRRAKAGYIDKNVGPYPVVMLTDEMLDSDARMKASIAADEEVRSEIDMHATREWEQLCAKLAKLPKMDFASRPDARSWMMGSMPLWVLLVHDRSERWAQLMQDGMAQGQTIAQVAQAALDESTISHVSTESYSKMVELLGRRWKYGQELEVWYHSKTA